MRSPLAVIRRRRDPQGVKFCEACGEVCDTACRALARRDRLRTRATLYGLGITDLNIDQ